MADENEVRALAQRFYAVAVASEGTDYMTAWDAAQHAAREALRWRDETRPQQPALAVPPERDWTMIQSGDASIPTWVVHYANAIGAYMKGQNVKHWAVGPVQSRNEAQQPAAAVRAANVTPMRQPRADLARLVESINAAVYANGDGLSVTEAIGALELAKLELLKEQEQ